MFRWAKKGRKLAMPVQRVNVVPLICALLVTNPEVGPSYRGNRKGFAMAVRILLLALGLFHAANGLAMLVFPQSWAANVVHQPVPSRLEFHFIADIGMAFLASGAALIWSARKGSAFAAWAVAGAAWPALHALIHVREWIVDGPPAATGDLLSEGLGVIVVGVAGLVLARLRFKTGDA
jgi:hypothetical protein